MHLKTKKRNTAFADLVKSFCDSEEVEETETRNGKVKVFSEPVTITFENPTERVLFNRARDANPFFHVFESLWMLAGRNDLKPLLKYVSTFGDFSDDGETLNGAYGYRWRQANASENHPEGSWQGDQLNILVSHLKKNPTSRRAVLQMWNVEDDLLNVDSSKDVCCNLSACFSIRVTGEVCSRCGKETDPELGIPNHTSTCNLSKGKPVKTPIKYLDMTVFNRSNDMVWGTCGANAVHFSFLQEYMAKRLGVRVGKYHQVSNNLHVYTETNSGWTPDKWLDYADEYSYEQDVKIQVPLVDDPETFDREVQKFIDYGDSSRSWKEPFLHKVAAPMVWAFEHHKRRSYSDALTACIVIKDDAWRLAATNWILKRQENWKKKNESNS